MRKLKSLVCGSKFGQFYIDAISKMKECVEFIGIRELMLLMSL